MLLQDFQSTTRRKRSTEVVTSDLIENRAAFSEWKKDKRRKASSSEEQWLDHQVKQSTNIKDHKVTINDNISTRRLRSSC